MRFFASCTRARKRGVCWWAMGILAKAGRVWNQSSQHAQQQFGHQLVEPLVRQLARREGIGVERHALELLRRVLAVLGQEASQLSVGAVDLLEQVVDLAVLVV